jgi:predicted nucleic acid-binding protein
MSDAKRFFDTNVLIYLLSGDAAKADRAEALIADGGIIGVQVLNEFVAVASRKLAMSFAEIREVLAGVRAVCTVEPLTAATHELALELAERNHLSFYDALIVAAATLAECGTLYSEDMQDGQVIAGVTIRNPFAND